jgi:hypothetical protein
MKSTSQTTECIACGSKDATLVPMSFMAEQAQFPICGACAAYIERVYNDPWDGPAFMQFLGVTDIQQPHQRGGTLSFTSPDGALPTDFASRFADFGLHCAFVGQRIRALRSIDTNNP